MKVYEVIGNSAQAPVQPSVLAQQTRVNKLIQQMAATDAQKPATEMDKVVAMQQMADLKKRTDNAYANRLRQQLANAEQQLR